MAEHWPSQVRSCLDASKHERSCWMGLSLFLVCGAAYLASFVSAALVSTLYLRIVLAIASALCVATLFLVGHDACHGSLTPKRWLNHVLGRLAFLPALTPYSAWEHSHNRMHHGWTNLRTRDPGYPPLTKAEFDALPPLRQAMQQLYRTIPGACLMFMFLIWWKLEIAPKSSHKPPRTWIFQLDRLLVVVFVAAQAWFVSTAARSQALTPVATAGLLALLMVLPFVMWCFLAGTLTVMHHTHPRVVWYDDAGEWSYFQGQVCGTVHVVFPTWLGKALLEIMEHTAHHVDARIPLYKLRENQRLLEATYPNNVIVFTWSLSGYRDTLRVCRLYDYVSRRWLDWDGRPTT